MSAPTTYRGRQRLLHWSMAVAIMAMFFIGAAMATSLQAREALLALHRPLGLLILVLAALRLWARLRDGAPGLPGHLPGWQRRMAAASHGLMYLLMFAMPLGGWAMLSAGGYPVTLYPGLQLPAIAPHDPALHGLLRQAHGIAAYAFFGLVLLHVAGALAHAWIHRDGVFARMGLGHPLPLDVPGPVPVDATQDASAGPGADHTPPGPGAAAADEPPDEGSAGR